METNMLKPALPAFKMLEGPFSQFYKNLFGKNGEKWLREFNRFLRQEPCWTELRKVEKNLILCTEFAYLEPRLERYLIAKHGSVDLIEKHGSVDSINLKKLFPREYQLFKNLNIKNDIEETRQIEAVPYRLRKRKGFSTLFSSFGCKLDDLSFTLTQFIYFIENYSNAINADKFESGFFLIKRSAGLVSDYAKFIILHVSYESSHMDSSQDYILSVSAHYFTEEGTFGRSEDILFIPRRLKQKNWLLRFNTWLINHM